VNRHAFESVTLTLGLRVVLKLKTQDVPRPVPRWNHTSEWCAVGRLCHHLIPRTAAFRHLDLVNGHRKRKVVKQWRVRRGEGESNMAQIPIGQSMHSDDSPMLVQQRKHPQLSPLPPSFSIGPRAHLDSPRLALILRRHLDLHHVTPFHPGRHSKLEDVPVWSLRLDRLPRLDTLCARYGQRYYSTSTRDRVLAALDLFSSRWGEIRPTSLLFCGRNSPENASQAEEARGLGMHTW